MHSFVPVEWVKSDMKRGYQQSETANVVSLLLQLHLLKCVHSISRMSPGRCHAVLPAGAIGDAYD